jgi:deoxyguanosine kinase
VIVALEGLPGAGKTTTAKLAAGGLGGEYVHERSGDHPFLDDFYRDIARYTLETELCFVLLHYHQYRDLDRDRLVLLDYSPVKDLVFADLNLCGADHDLFEALYARTSGSLPVPDLTVFLDLELDLVLQRIRERGRDYERDIDPSYLAGLRDAYTRRYAELGSRVERLAVDSTMTREDVAAAVCAIVSGS